MGGGAGQGAGSGFDQKHICMYEILNLNWQTESKNTSEISSTIIKSTSSQRCRDGSIYENLSM